MLLSFQLSAQDDFVGSKSFMYPNELEFGKVKSLFSLTLAKLPEDAVEEVSSNILAPLFNYDILYGLPMGFSGHGNFTTNWVTFHLSLGPKWNYRFKRVSFSIGYDVAYVYGRIFNFGFDSEIKGWLNYPNITIGAAIEKVTLSVKAEATITTSLTQFNDDVEVGSDKNKLSGVAVSAIVEQPLWKDNIIALSFKGNYTRLYYPAWAVFPTWDRYSFIPEIIIGIVF